MEIFCWWLLHCYEEVSSNRLLSYYAYHFRAGEVAWLLCLLNLINLSASVIQVLGNGSSISSKSTRLQNNIFGTSIPCDSLVLQLSYPAILISALLFLSFAGFCYFNCMFFLMYCCLLRNCNARSMQPIRATATEIPLPVQSQYNTIILRVFRWFTCNVLIFNCCRSCMFRLKQHWEDKGWN